jgi:hypothetical protein
MIFLYWRRRMDDKITIIEGPPPVFEETGDGWAIGLNESPYLYDLMLTRLRTFNGPALIERCHRTWKSQSMMYLHYRDELGLEERAPILAARTVETPEGQVLMLWVRLKPEQVEKEIDSDNED